MEHDRLAISFFDVVCVTNSGARLPIKIQYTNENVKKLMMVINQVQKWMGDGKLCRSFARYKVNFVVSGHILWVSSRVPLCGYIFKCRDAVSQ